MAEELKEITPVGPNQKFANAEKIHTANDRCDAVKAKDSIRLVENLVTRVSDTHKVPPPTKK